MTYIAEIESTVAGIPCLIGVTYFHKQEPDHRADSDWDYYGYTETEWEVLDSRGRKAEWLERKLTDSMRDDIEVEIAEYMKEMADD